MSRMLKNIGLFCKRALQKRPVFCKETCIFKHPTHRSHPISLSFGSSLIISTFGYSLITHDIFFDMKNISKKISCGFGKNWFWLFTHHIPATIEDSKKGDRFARELPLILCTHTFLLYICMYTNDSRKCCAIRLE